MEITTDESAKIQKRIKKAVNSDNVSDIQELIKELGPDKDTTETYIAQAYDELKIKNIRNEKVEFEIIKYLIKKRFAAKQEKRATKHKEIPDKELKKRIEFTIECIEDIIEEHSMPKDDCYGDDTFILIGKFIAKNLRLLRRDIRVKRGYGRLPWEEMEFCLSIFIQSSLNQSKTIYSLIVAKEKIVYYLQQFSNELKKEMLLKERSNKKLKSIEVRNPVVENNNINFNGLYDIYYLAKNVYSLTRILSYLKVATTVDLEQDGLTGKLVLERALQVTGEYLKDTRESPNISNKVKRLLHDTGPKQLKNVVTKLRDSLSHTPSLMKRMELEDDQDQTFFTSVLTDLKKIQIDICCILYFQKINIFLEYGLENIELLSEELIQENDNVDEEKYFSEIINIFEELKQKYYSEENNNVNNICAELTFYRDNFVEIKKSYLEAATRICSCDYNPSFSFNIVQLSLIKHNLDLILRSKKFTVESALVTTYNLRNKIILNNPTNAKQIDDLLFKLWRLVLNERQIKAISNMSKVVRSDTYTEKSRRVQKVLLHLESILVVEDEKEIFNKQVKAKMGIEKISHLVKVEDCLLNNHSKKEIKDVMIQCGKEESEIISLLEPINITNLRDQINSMNIFGQFLNKVEGFHIFSYEKDIELFVKFLHKLDLGDNIKKKVSDEIDNLIQLNKKRIVEYYCRRLEQLKEMNKYTLYPKMVLVIEMLILDLLEILEYSNALENNRYILETNAPLLVGKALRNYLAHGDVLVDVLMDKETISDILITNTCELIERGKDLIEEQNTLVGRNIQSDTNHTNKLYKRQLNILKIQQNTFTAAKEGNVEEFESCLHLGGGVFAVNTNGWSCAHFAAKGNQKELLQRSLIKGTEDKEGYTALQVAAENGGLDVLQYLLELFEEKLLPAEILNLFNLAVKNGHQKVVHVLLQKMKNLNAVYTTLDSCFRALQTVAHAQELAFVSDLISEFNSNIKAIAGRDYTESALHFAAKNGHLSISKLLIENNAALDVVNRFGFAPLHYATSGGHVDVALALLKAGASVDVKSKSKDLVTSLHIAAIHGEVEIAKMLIDYGADTKALSADGLQAIHLAVEMGKQSVVELMIEKGVNINDATPNGHTCLHLAAIMGHTQIVRYILSKGASVNAENCKQETPLHLAALYGHANIIKEIATGGVANLQALNKDGYTPLHKTALFDSVETAQALLDLGANVSVKTTDGQTLLELAVTNGSKKIVKLLIEKSSAEDIEAGFMLTSASDDPYIAEEFLKVIDSTELMLKALKYTAQLGTNDVFDLIIKKIDDSSFSSSLCKEILTKSFTVIPDADIVKTLLEKFPNMKVFDEDNYLLKAAITTEDERIIEALLIHGADANYLYENYYSPLMMASGLGYVYVADTLLKYGADPCQATNRQSVLHCAAMSDHKKTIQLIIAAIEMKHEGELKEYRVKNEYDFTPLMLAASIGANNAVRLLLKHGVNVNEQNCKGLTALMCASFGNKLETMNILKDHIEKHQEAVG